MSLPNPDNPNEREDGTVVMNAREEAELRRTITQIETEIHDADTVRSDSEKEARNVQLPMDQRNAAAARAEEARKTANHLAGRISALRAKLPRRSGRA